MEYYYVKDGILNGGDEEYIVVITLLSSEDTGEFPQIVIDNCVMNVNQNGLSNIEIDWHSKTTRHHQIISEGSNDAFVIKSSDPVYSLNAPWGSFLPSGKCPIILEDEYAIETRD